MPKGTAVFLDTSIMIAWFVHARQTKARINEEIAKYNILVTGEIVKQEFKRRLLMEARYLLNKLDQMQSLEDVRRFVEGVLPVQRSRKQSICLALLSTIDETAGDREKTRFARSMLRNLLVCGLDDFESRVDSVVTSAGCVASRSGLRPKRSDWDFGPDRCSKAKTACPIGVFVSERANKVSAIKKEIAAASSEIKTDELLRIEGFIEKFKTRLHAAHEADPCLTLGDFLIALESADFRFFYTMNFQESAVLCSALEQNPVVLPVNFTKPVAEPPTE